MTQPAPIQADMPSAARVLRLLHLEDNDLDHELIAESLRADLDWEMDVRRAEDEGGGAGASTGRAARSNTFIPTDA